MTMTGNTSGFVEGRTRYLARNIYSKYEPLLWNQTLWPVLDCMSGSIIRDVSGFSLLCTF